MEGRARLAQSLTSRLKRPAVLRRPSALAWAPSAARWPRFLRRWGLPLFDLDIPRGAGASAAALLLLASVTYGAVKGGHGPDMAANVQNLCDAAANSLGFRISRVALAGEHEVGRERILASAGITGRSSLLFLDAAAARERLLANPWIAQATVLKLYPGELRITIKERRPFALWQKDGQVRLIADDGTVLETYVPPRFAGLPQVVGQGAGHAAAGLIALLQRYPSVARRVEASVLVAERRWNLHLKDGVEVLLPEHAPERALGLLVDLDRDKKLPARDIVAVDLRLPDRVIVRQSEAAAAARDAALKAEAAKDKKKRKGGEA